MERIYPDDKIRCSACRHETVADQEWIDRSCQYLLRKDLWPKVNVEKQEKVAESWAWAPRAALSYAKCSACGLSDHAQLVKRIQPWSARERGKSLVNQTAATPAVQGDRPIFSDLYEITPEEARQAFAFGLNRYTPTEVINLWNQRDRLSLTAAELDELAFAKRQKSMPYDFTVVYSKGRGQ